MTSLAPQISSNNKTSIQNIQLLGYNPSENPQQNLNYISVNEGGKHLQNIHRPNYNLYKYILIGGIIVYYVTSRK